MKTAIIGSRTLQIENFWEYLPRETTEIISGGANGIDRCAKVFAEKNQIKITEFLSEYRRYGRGAPLKRNLHIIAHADLVLAFWDGKSRGTADVIEQYKRQQKPIRVYILPEKGRNAKV